jgi:hypothetical protein
VPLAKGLLFIENITAMKPGQGLWVTAAGEPPTFRIHVPDPAAGVVGMMAVIRRRTDQGVAPAILAVRLAVVNGVITEAEHLVGDVGASADPKRLAAPRRNLTAAVPESERMPRSALAISAGTPLGMPASR